MTYDINYTLTPAQLAAYRKLVLSRVRKAAAGRSWQHNSLARLLMGVVLGVVAILLLVLILMLFTGQEPDPAALIGGIVAGMAIVFAAIVHQVRGAQAVSFRPDGPTLALHKGSADDNGLRLSSPYIGSTFRWSAFSDVTEAGDLVVLWTEPSQGIVIPRAGFADEATAKAFCDFARWRISAAASAPPQPAA
jgi:YcxB-like protein